VPRAAPVNPQAYEQVLLGRHIYLNRFSSPGGFRRAAEAYERAIAIDPGFAPAWAGLGVPLFYSAYEARTPEAARAMRERALAAAERAVALDPDTAEGLSTRGTLRALVRHDWLGAQADLERAVEVSPGSADATRRYAIVLAELSRLPEAVARARRAVELDPMSMPSWTKLGQVLAMAGALEEARSALVRALELVPDAQAALVTLGDVLLLQRRPEDAAAVFARCVDERDRLRGTAMVEHARGRDVASLRALRALERKHPGAGLEVAEVRAWRGEVNGALDALERCYASGEPLGEGFAHDPILRPLRGQPRFTTLLQKLNLPVE
jgi:tetratricopeptide (TPR) repeat protein